MTWQQMQISAAHVACFSCSAMCHRAISHMAIAVAVASERTQVLEALRLPAEVLSHTIVNSSLKGITWKAHDSRVRMKKSMLKKNSKTIFCCVSHCLFNKTSQRLNLALDLCVAYA